MNVFSILLAFTICFFSAGHSRAEILLKDGETVAFMGDSITQWGIDQDGGWVRLVKAALASQGVNITVINAGVSGNTSRQMVARIDSQVINRNPRPTWMTLSAGVNDVNNAVELPEYRSNMTAMLDKCQQAGIKVLVLTATQINLPVTNPQNVKLAGYNDFMREIAAARGLPLADVNAGIVAEQAVYTQAGAERALTTDGVHMNIYGNMVMAKGVLAAFGFNDSQLAAAQATWNQRPDVYPLPDGPTPRGDGSGLTGHYYSDLSFSPASLVQTQIDTQLYNFQWRSGSPTNVDRTKMSGMPEDNFGVRWTGQLQAMEEGVYRIKVDANDTAKVWIGDLNGPPLINKLVVKGPESNDSVRIFLLAGQKYDIKIDYTDLTGDADIGLGWTRPAHAGVGTLPRTQLFPNLGTTTPLLAKVATPTFSLQDGTYTGTQNVRIISATSTATIRYTTDGTDPTNSSPVASGAISIPATTTLKAKAFLGGAADSAVASATYTINTAQP